jgi:hypothetical protein
MKTKRNLIQTCLLSAVLLQAATSGAQTVTINTSTLIDVGNTTYEGKDIIVTGCTLTVNGSHAFNSLQVTDTALVTHSPAAAGQTNNRVNLTITQDVSIDGTSTIDASFKGYNADFPGPGAGVTGTVGGDWGSGGGYGGFGADGSAGATGGSVYGSIMQPVDWGSAGGSCPSHSSLGGTGGGAIHLVVGGTLTVNGQIVANGSGDSTAPGGAGDHEIGGGAGGSIWLTVGTLAGTGTLSAIGGNGDTDFDSGGGGGGRIAVYYGTSTFSGTIAAQTSPYSSYPGGAGTIYMKAASQTAGSVLVDNGGLNGAATGLTSPEAFGLTITNGGSGVALAPLTLGALHLATNCLLTQLAGSTNLSVVVLSDAVIDLGGALTLDGKGYPIGTNLGPGAAPANPGYYAGGAGYGGLGGSAWGGSAGGPVYGSVMQPVDLGSAGATGNGQLGSAGGGALQLTVNGTLTVNGIISANGTSLATSGYHGGCGSGGSLWLSVGALQGGGVISANGGSGPADGDGGAGGGGRIAIYYTDASGFNLASQVTALGGGPFNQTFGNEIGAGAGTIYTKASSQSVGSVLVDNGGNSGMLTPLTAPEAFALTITNGGSGVALAPLTLGALHIATNGSLAQLAGSPNLTLVVLNDAVIDAGGALTLDGKGYPISANLGPGAAPEVNYYAGGGGYGGQGGAGWGGAPGGPTYGSLMQPVDLGSAGGTGVGEPGSAGGGAIRFTVAGTLLLNGTISANGGSFTPGHGGCGSGGSIWLTTGTLQGSGSISANGGSGRSDCDGGAGGGGRIAIYYENAAGFSFTNQVFALGGGPFTCPNTLWGGAGTIYLKGSSQSVGDLLVNNGGNLGALTPLTSPEAFNLTVAGNAVVSASQGLTLTTFHLCTNSVLTDLAGDASLNVVVLTSALIDQGGVITADANGYPIGANLGPGAAPEVNYYAGGGGYGGQGGAGWGGAPGGPTYGSLMQPVDLGSAGGTGNGQPGSAGGGAIRFTVADTLLLNGAISANGVSLTPGYGGCGSGGSIWLTTGTLQGSGSISANGGTGRSDCDGGGGGGGRIALYYGSNGGFDLAQQLSASGGGPFTCPTFGQTGTVYIATTTVPPSLTVLSSVPNGGLPRPFADYIELVFSEAVNPATFAPADVTITTPSGQIPAAQVTVSNTGGTRWRVAFPRQTANGSYQYVVGPHIADLFGTEMASSYSGSFVLDQTGWPNRLSFTTTASTLQLAMPSLTGMDYQVLWSTDLINWQSLGPVTPGDGTTLNWTIPMASPPAAFFRIQISDAP